MNDDAPNLSRFHDFEASELHPIVEEAFDAKGDAACNAYVALFRNRSLRLLRKGSSVALAAEAAVLNRHLYSGTGRALQQENPGYHARLATIADMLTTAGQRTDSTFVGAVLASHKKYATTILEALADAGEDGLPRRELLPLLGVTESHLSHILHDLAKADVIVRKTSPGLKEVRILLGPAGHDRIAEKILPDWFTEMERFIVEAARGSLPDMTAITRSLQAAKVPSRTLASRISNLVAIVADAKTLAVTRN
jgi:DNA-binding MarR family transcriptional regulator